MKNQIVAGAGLMACVLAWAAKDPVIMTVNGIDVPKSEFEYLYHKNSQQQLSAQPLDEYVEMFKLYKLKVADARAAGIDTTKSFLNDMSQYKADLSAPYLADSTYLETFVDEAFQHSGEEVEYRHIMLGKTRNYRESEAKRVRMDSIRAAILAGEADFDAMAMTYSDDQNSGRRGGVLGFVTSGKLPYALEKASWSLPEGQISDVIESTAGFHIVQGGKRRPARGTVLTEHIMLMVPPGSDAATEENIKVRIDSIYNVVTADPGVFEKLAMEISDDKGSGRNGGRLPWFGAGDMVPEFDAAAFALADGQISQPVRSQYGWHVIKRLESRGVPSKEELKPMVLSRLNNAQDDRYRLVRDQQTARLAKKHKATVNRQLIDAMKKDMSVAGIDSAFYAKYNEAPNSEMPIFTIDGKKVRLGNMFDFMRGYRQPDPELAVVVIDNAVDNYYNRCLKDAESDWLEANVEEYRNLLNEYREGSLLYEISVRNVWDKASKDKEGLENYFQTHRDNYKWKEPHVKGYLVQTVNDTVADKIRTRMSQLGNDTIVRTIIKEFPSQVKIEKLLVTKGTNPMVDNIVFGGDKVKPQNAAFNTYFMYDWRVIDAPEEVADVRGSVTSDYQNELEQAWIEELKSKYPVKINEKVLKKVK